MNPQPILPAGFDGVLANLIAQKKATAQPIKTRRGLLADVERDIALGKQPPPLEFKSEVNYTYNRHAAAIYALWQARDVAGLKAYAMAGKNTYARALARYRDLLVDDLEGDGK